MTRSAVPRRVKYPPTEWKIAVFSELFHVNVPAALLWKEFKDDSYVARSGSVTVILAKNWQLGKKLG